MITNLNLCENIHIKREAVAQDYQVLPLHTGMSMFSASFQGLGLTSCSSGCPTLTSFQGFLFSALASSLVVPINIVVSEISLLAATELDLQLPRKQDALSGLVLRK